MLIEGTKSGKNADVTEDLHLMVEAISKTDLEYNSLNLKRGYSVVSRYAATANDYALSIENTSEITDFIVDEIEVGASAAAEFEIGFVVDGTPAGTSATAKNLNGSGTNTGSLTCFGGAAVTGVTSTDILGYTGVSAAKAHKTLDTLSGIVLTKNIKFYIRALDTATVTITVWGHFRES